MSKKKRRRTQHPRCPLNAKPSQPPPQPQATPAHSASPHQQPPPLPSAHSPPHSPSPSPHSHYSLPLACINSQRHYHPRLPLRRQPYPHTHTTSNSTCVQLASASAYCSILPRLGILLHTPKSTHNSTTCQIHRCHIPRFTAPQHPRSYPTRRLSRGNRVPL